MQSFTQLLSLKILLQNVLPKASKCGISKQPNAGKTKQCDSWKCNKSLDINENCKHLSKKSKLIKIDAGVLGTYV